MFTSEIDVHHSHKTKYFNVSRDLSYMSFQQYLSQKRHEVKYLSKSNSIYTV